MLRFFFSFLIYWMFTENKWIWLIVWSAIYVEIFIQSLNNWSRNKQNLPISQLSNLEYKSLEWKDSSHIKLRYIVVIACQLSPESIWALESSYLKRFKKGIFAEIYYLFASKRLLIYTIFSQKNPKKYEGR